MTFPVVATVNYSEETADTTTHDVLVPASIGAGDRLVLFAILDGASTTISGMPAGWTSVTTDTIGGLSMTVWEKITASGSETNFTYTSSASEQSANRTWRVTGAHASSAMEFSSVQSTGGVGTINPGIVTPSWGVEDTLWVAVVGLNGSCVISVYPTNYTNNQFNDGTGTGISGAAVGLASRSINAASENPDVFTWSPNSDVMTRTYAIRTAAAGGGAVVLDPFGMSGFFGS